jgi:hypothetical protein
VHGRYCRQRVENRKIPLIEYENNMNVNPKDKDDFYYFMVDNFADYLQEFYNKQCA